MQALAGDQWYGSKGEVGQTEKVMPEPPKRWWGPGPPFLALRCFWAGYKLCLNRILLARRCSKDPTRRICWPDVDGRAIVSVWKCMSDGDKLI